MRRSLLPFLLLFSLANCGPCPDGYSQAPNGGDCFKVINFYDSFSGNYFPKTFDEAEIECSNNYAGGMLASIHSPDEMHLIRNNNDPNIACRSESGAKNIGLRCTGKDCRWNDATPVTYTNFAGDGPSENDGEACYAISGSQNKWKKKSCGKQNSDCWICRVKARTIDCVDGEIEYKGGCISIQTSPLDLNSAKDFCPRGGSLASIHGGSEKNIYKNAALATGLNGSIYIGAQFTKGVFGWIDESRNNYGNWATGFPTFTMETACKCCWIRPSEFKDNGRMLIARQNSLTFVSEMKMLLTPLLSVYSPNYPLSIPVQHNCTYVLTTNEGTRASIKFLDYDCQGTALSLYDTQLSPNDPFLTFTTEAPVIGQYYSALSNTLQASRFHDTREDRTGRADEIYIELIKTAKPTQASSNDSNTSAFRLKSFDPSVRIDGQFFYFHPTSIDFVVDNDPSKHPSTFNETCLNLWAAQYSKSYDDCLNNHTFGSNEAFCEVVEVNRRSNECDTNPKEISGRCMRRSSSLGERIHDIVYPDGRRIAFVLWSCSYYDESCCGFGCCPRLRDFRSDTPATTRNPKYLNKSESGTVILVFLCFVSCLAIIALAYHCRQRRKKLARVPTVRYSVTIPPPHNSSDVPPAFSAPPPYSELPLQTQIKI